MKRLEYGFARSFVAQHKNYIEQEMKKLRTVKSIWKELQSNAKDKISYRIFVYHVSNQIAKNLPLQYYIGRKDTQKKSERHDRSISHAFEFTTQVNSEEII